jgi:hypothetical protein
MFASKATRTWQRRKLSLVASIADVDRLVSVTAGEFGGIAIAFINAGIFQMAALEETTDEIWDRHLGGNLTGAFYCARRAVYRPRHRAGDDPRGVLDARFGDARRIRRSTVRVSPTGEVTVLTGVTSPGSGNETALAQIAADVLGCDMKRVKVIQGDTDTCPWASALPEWFFPPCNFSPQSPTRARRRCAMPSLVISVGAPDTS